MRPVSVSETINASSDWVFALATDLESAVERVGAISAIEVLSGTPFGVGTRWRETRRFGGREAVEVMEVTAFERGISYTTVAQSHGCRYVSGFAAEPTEGGATRATFTFRGEAVTLGARVMLALMTPFNGMLARQVRDAFAADLADLRAAAEAADGHAGQ